MNKNWVDVPVEKLTTEGLTSTFDAILHDAKQSPFYITNRMQIDLPVVRFYFDNSKQGKQAQLLFAIKWSG